MKKIKKVYVKPASHILWIGGEENVAQDVTIPVGSNATPDMPDMVKEELDDDFGGNELPQAPNLWDNVW